MTKSSWVSAVLRVEKPWGHEEHFALVEGVTAERRCTSMRVTRSHFSTTSRRKRRLPFSQADFSSR